MSVQELKAKAPTELRAERDKLQRKLLKLRLTINQDDAAPKPHEFRVLRKEIARINTVLTQNKIEERS